MIFILGHNKDKTNRIYYLAWGLQMLSLSSLKNKWECVSLFEIRKIHTLKGSVQNLCEEKFKALLQDLNIDLDKWKHIPWSWIRIYIIKMSVHLKWIYRVNTFFFFTLQYCIGFAIHQHESKLMQFKYKSHLASLI